ncbi:arylamine N-acetyltransferase family protein [Oceanobacillus rekensis]|uniref:arylamine N-acetyltransferase family protein n=1 Tax=Oceanobacillus rekensis TaxID=937927 RepID=UPI000B445AFF|nr:arylamine N-acetyltransferase [Oceanobacillus rekensis]
MNNINILFHNRLGIPYNEKITFENLHIILEKTAKTIPFENLSIIGEKTTEITEDNLVHKILQQNEGGLCYELNTILNLFLVENGFNAVLIRGVVYDQMNQKWSTTGKTHVANLIRHHEQQYLVDTGFGGNLPLRPVPINGEIVASNNGEFRVDRIESEHGDYIFYMKLKYKDKDWKIGYALDSKDVIRTLPELNDVQKTIREHPDSAFNKNPLITRLTDKGNLTLTETSFTEWVDGKLNKKEIDKQSFHDIAEKYFSL